MVENGFFREFFARYGAKLLGALLGLVAGILFILLGFWKTLLIIALALIGWFLGGRLDGQWKYRMKSVLRRIVGTDNED